MTAIDGKHQSSTAQFDCRPDIDGHRAIAFLAVIVCRLNASWLPRGRGLMDGAMMKLVCWVTSIEIYEDWKRRGARCVP